VEGKEGESQQGHRTKIERKKARGTEEGRKNEPEMGRSSTPLKLKNGKAKANPRNRHGIKSTQ
jgi:hypothetical protein